MISQRSPRQDVKRVIRPDATARMTDDKSGQMKLRSDVASTLEIEAVVRGVATDIANGLTAPEAARRLATDGANELRAAPPIAGWRRLLAQFQDPLIYLLLAAIAISLIAWVLEGMAGWPIDAIVIAIIVAMNAVIGYVQETRAESAVAALARMTAVTSAVLRDGQVRRVPSAELVRGDVLVLEEGDAVG